MAEDDEVLQLVQPYDMDVPHDAVAAVLSAILCQRVSFKSRTKV